MQKLSPTNGRAIYLLWTNTKLSSGNLKMASHSHKCTYTLWISRDGSEEYTIIAPRSDFKGILMSIIFGLTDETIWILSLMCLCGGWWITNQYALTQTINVGASSAYTYPCLYRHDSYILSSADNYSIWSRFRPKRVPTFRLFQNVRCCLREILEPGFPRLSFQSPW